jgi:sialic acid synthase SpsE
VDLPLIEYVAKTKKPLILSTGMAAKQEIRDAVITARKFDVADLALLKCVSSYPARPDEMNLRTIIDLAKSFKCTVGLSDHTLGTAVSVAAVANGAKIIEKHFTLSRKIRTPDSFFSLEPDELTRLVNDIRVAEVAMGKVKYNFLGEEAKSKIFRRSLFIVADIKKGDVFTLDNVRSIRPSNGLHPQKLKNVLGKKASRAIKKGTPLSWKLVA